MVPNGSAEGEMFCAAMQEISDVEVDKEGHKCPRDVHGLNLMVSEYRINSVVQRLDLTDFQYRIYVQSCKVLLMLFRFNANIRRIIHIY